MTDPSETVDDEVLRLRRQGHAYARISREFPVWTGPPTLSRRSYGRCVACPPWTPRRSEARSCRGRERLAERVAPITSKNDIDRARQLQTIERMRGKKINTMIKYIPAANLTGSAPRPTESAENHRTRDE